MYRHLNRKVSQVAGTWIKPFLLLAMALLLTLVLQAQTIFPVQSTTRILSPYSVYLADYAVNGNNKLQCILVNRDASLNTYTVRLRLTVKLNGRVIMQTSNNYNPAPITLSPNSPQIFAGATLEPYLKSENLDFVGYNRDYYEQIRALPEGFYEIGFAAFDYTRQDVQVSNDGYGFYFLAKNEPPLLNLPACGSKITPQYSMPMRFSWMPRNTASLNSSNSTYYRFYLYEVNPTGTNPNDIANSLPPIYIDSTNINQTYFDLLPTTTLFQDTYQYVWRVQAVDQNGADLFRNNGYSEVCTFYWGGSGANPYGGLDSVLNLNALAETERKGKMWWTKDLVKFDGYKVHYKKSGSGYSWFTSETEGDTVRVFDLEPDTEYECRLQGKKNGSFGMYSEVRYFRTKKIIPVECNNVTNVPVGNSGRPMVNLQPNSVVTYRDFEIKVTDSITSNQPGWYSGNGKVSIPFLGGREFAVQFQNIYVDDAGQVSQGTVQFKSRDLQDWWKEQRNERAGGNNVGEVLSGTMETDYTTGYTIASPTQINVVLPPVDGKTNILIARPTPPGGIDTLKNVTLPYTIEDSEGNIYNATESGQIVKIGTNSGSESINETTFDRMTEGRMSLDKIKVTFKAHPDQIFGFDSWQERFAGKTLIEQEYEKLNDSLSLAAYYVANKAIGASKADKVIAKIEIIDPQYKADSVRFMTATGTRLTVTATSTAGEYSLNLIGGPAGDGQELFAFYPESSGNLRIIGKLKIVSYAKITKRVILVPVTDSLAELAPIRSQLKRTYAPYNIDIALSIQPKFHDRDWDQDGDDALDVTGSGILSQYSIEMRKLNQQYSRIRTLQPDELYLFILKKAKGALTADGDMPRGSRFGYLFTEVSGTTTARLARTIAHEIGHGVFNLQHTFDNTIGLTEGATGNLMDYATGDSLYKYQWDQLHDPGIVDKLFEQDEDGLSLKHPDLKCIHNATVIASLGKIFLNNKGESVHLRSDEIPYAFFGPKEGHLYGRLAAYKKTGNGKTYIYLVHADREKEDIPAGVYAPLGNWENVIQLDPENDLKGLLVKIPESNILNGTNLGKCNCPDLEKVLGEVSPDKTYKKGGKGGSGPTIEIIDHTHTLTQAELEKLRSRFSGKDKHIDEDGIESRTTKLTVFITNDATPAAEKNTIEAYEPAFGEVAFCMNISNGKPTFKWIRFGDKAAENNYNENLLLLGQGPGFWQSFFNGWPQASLSEMLGVMYDGLDWMCKQIAKAKIPRFIWDCEAKNYDGTGSKIFELLLKPVFVAGNMLITPYLGEVPNFDVRASQVTFAMACGVWNGLIEMAESIPTALKLLVSAGSNNPAHRKELSVLGDAIKENGGGFPGFVKTIWSGIKDQHNPDSVCKFAHTIGSDVFTIAAIYFTAGQSLAASAAGNAVKTALVTLEKLDIISQIISKATGYVLKVGYSAGKRVINFAAPGVGQVATNVFKATTNAVRYHVQIWDIATKTWKDIDWTGGFSVVVRGLNGEEIPTKILGHNLDNFKTGVQKIKEILKDENGRVFANDAGDALAHIENPNGELTTAFVRQAGKTSKGIYKSIPEMVDAIVNARKSINENVIKSHLSKDIADQYYHTYWGLDRSRVPTTMTFDTWYEKYFLNGSSKAPWEAHHVLPINVLQESPFLKQFMKWLDENELLEAFNFNSLDNGIAVQKMKIKKGINGHASHPNYDEQIILKLAEIESYAAGNMEVAFDEITRLITETKKKIKKNVIFGGQDIDELKLL